MNTCKISKSLSKFLWNFSFTKEEVCFPVNICLPIVTYSTFVFLERTRSRHWRTFTLVWSIRNYLFYFTLLFLLQKNLVLLFVSICSKIMVIRCWVARNFSVRRTHSRSSKIIPHAPQFWANRTRTRTHTFLEIQSHIYFFNFDFSNFFMNL